MLRFLILVGTVNGHALLAAQGAAAILNKLGHQSRIDTEPSVAEAVRDSSEIILASCSTTDQGSLPRNIYPLYQALDDQRLDLQGRYFGVLALGDSYFPPSQYAMGGIKLENAFYCSGARRIGEIGLLDAQQVENYALAAALWTQAWVAKAEAVVQSNLKNPIHEPI